MRRLAADEITFAAAPALVRLFSQLPFPVIRREGKLDIAHNDYWTQPLSLPRWALAEPGPYLAATPSRRGGVGVMWKGNDRPDPGRSLPADVARALLARPGVISLQPEDTGATDFLDTAEVIAGQSDLCRHRVCPGGPWAGCAAGLLPAIAFVMDLFEAALRAHRNGDLGTAERGYRALLEQSDNDKVWSNLGSLLAQIGSRDAEPALRRAAEIRPDFASHHYNLGNYLWRCRRLYEARSAYAMAWSIDPTVPDLAVAYGNTLLALGDRSGWALYDQRPERLRSETHRLGFPEWQGEDLSGKRLFVWGEQGLGDQILAARFLSRIGAAGITAACTPSLGRLFEQLPVSVVIKGEKTSVEPHDHWTMMMSLARWTDGPLWTGPYLRSTAPRSGGIGIMWRGNARPDPGRSLPEELGRELLAIPGTTDLDPAATGARDFADTAEIVAGLDLVVSVDTSVAHLAGAMGKPVWLLLQRNSADWRWEQPWYPDARLFRQSEQGDWSSAVEQVMALIKIRYRT